MKVNSYEGKGWHTQFFRGTKTGMQETWGREGGTQQAVVVQRTRGSGWVPHAATGCLLPAAAGLTAAVFSSCAWRISSSLTWGEGGGRG